MFVSYPLVIYEKSVNKKHLLDSLMSSIKLILKSYYLFYYPNTEKPFYQKSLVNIILYKITASPFFLVFAFIFFQKKHNYSTSLYEEII